MTEREVATDDLTKVRIAENQARFRRANENIESTAELVGVVEQVPFICECADRGCATIVTMSLGAYEEIRESPRRFFNAVGHEKLTVESGAGVVVARKPSYLIVDKIGVAGEVAVEDSRRANA